MKRFNLALQCTLDVNTDICLYSSLSNAATGILPDAFERLFNCEHFTIASSFKHLSPVPLSSPNVSNTVSFNRTLRKICIEVINHFQMFAHFGFRSTLSTNAHEIHAKIVLTKYFTVSGTM